VPRIGLHPLWLDSDPNGGIATYWNRLIENLVEIAPPELRFTVYFTSDASIAASRSPASVDARVVTPASAWLRLPFAMPLEIRRRPVDLLHFQMLAPPVCATPFVLTINDIAWETNPELFPWPIRLRLKLLVGRDARRAARVFTVSEYSKRLICEHYRLPATRVTVTYHGADERFRRLDDPAATAELRRRFGLDAGFVLYVGKLQARKNLVRLLEAFDRVVREGGLPHKLVLVGKRTWMSDEIFAALERLPSRERVVVAGEVSFDDLVALYNAATVFACPSLAEGFGLPPLEAMACGTPVISSNASSLPEDVGDAAILFDPLDTDAMARALADVLGSDSLRRTLVDRGFARVARFSNRRMAATTLAEYQAVLRECGPRQRPPKSHPARC
jgi:glycosyltransferase involved in cell wall biosynthesis